jgi:predicted TIM-barrel fold metal-dependent hydrolase
MTEGTLSSRPVPTGTTSKPGPRTNRPPLVRHGRHPFPHRIPALTAAFGNERLVYGSDYCWTPAAGTTAQVDSVDAAPQPDGDTWRALTTRNAQRLFPRLRDLAATGCS